MEDFRLDQLGTPEHGINYDETNDLCLVDPLPDAMNPLRQQMITAVVVRAFFDGVFAVDTERQGSAQSFLTSVLPSELDEVSYASAD